MQAHLVMYDLEEGCRLPKALNRKYITKCNTLTVWHNCCVQEKCRICIVGIVYLYENVNFYIILIWFNIIILWMLADDFTTPWSCRWTQSIIGSRTEQCLVSNVVFIFNKFLFVFFFQEILGNQCSMFMDCAGSWGCNFDGNWFTAIQYRAIH